jgi:flavin-dependent dehydrogenase
MARGRDIIESLFPRITSEFLGRGALMADTVAAARWFQNGGYHHETVSGTQTLLMSRPLLEGLIRDRLLARGNVRVRERSSVTGLVAEGARVTGVRLAGDEEMAADLVVDASGRGSQLPAWLQALGYDAPLEIRAGTETRYATRLFRRCPEHLPGRLAVIVVAPPESRRGGVMLAQEDDRWLVTLGGRGGERPPTDLAAFIDYARSHPAPEVFQVISAAKPIGDAAVYGFRSNHRRAYHQLARFPSGLLPFADAICAFNPVYAQGMSIAAIEDDALRRCLADGAADLAPRFFAAIVRDVDDAWKLAASADARYAPASVALPRKVRAINWYLDRLHIAARHEPAVSVAFREVVNLTARPASLLRPAIATRVLRGNLRQRWLDAREPLPTPVLPERAAIAP